MEMSLDWESRCETDGAGPQSCARFGKFCEAVGIRRMLNVASVGARVRGFRLRCGVENLVRPPISI